MIKLNKKYIFVSVILTALTLTLPCLAVTSKITRHSTQENFLKGQMENVIIDSKGTLQLSRDSKTVISKLEQDWSINCIIDDKHGNIFLGTSPNGAIFKFAKNKLKKIYSLEEQKDLLAKEKEPNDFQDLNTPAEQYLANLHIFAMGRDSTDRLLAAVSGQKCQLLRFDNEKPEPIFEPNDAKYIFAIATDQIGNIYLATGPEGKVYRLDPFGKAPQVIYDSEDKNILSLAIDKDGMLYAGSDTRGLVYKINPKTKTATVLYDAKQQEISSLLFDDQGNLYAAATSVTALKTKAKFPTAQTPAAAGRPETKNTEPKSDSKKSSGQTLKIPNTQQKSSTPPKQPTAPPKRTAPSGGSSYIYKITEDGFVTDVFVNPAVFFTLAAQDKQLLLGTGNKAELFGVNPETEQQVSIYKDKQSSQITAIATVGQDLYIGTANPAKVIKLSKNLAEKGTYISSLLDAGQPAQWGKIQLDADIPKNSRVLIASRSGNVDDVNDPTFSKWSDETQIDQPVQLNCPLGRFCQYKLVLKTKKAKDSPEIREVAVAHTIPNLAPKVKSVAVTRAKENNKKAILKITYNAQDDNEDKLIYKIDFRKLGRTSWIELEKDLDKNSFEWDTRTVEDGRYEIRVTADDRPGNTKTTKLTATRISEPVVVDNTPPKIEKHKIKITGQTATVKLKITDRFSVIGRLSYTVDSNTDFKSTLPEDMIYDTTTESFTVVIDELKKGEHVIAFKIVDDLENITYKTFDIIVEK